MCGQVEPYLQLHICTLSNFIDLIGCLGKTYFFEMFVNFSLIIMSELLCH